MRNVSAKVSSRDKARLAEKLKEIWLQPDKAGAEKVAPLIIEEYKEKYPEAMGCLEEGLEDSLQFYYFSEIERFHPPMFWKGRIERLDGEVGW